VVVATDDAAVADAVSSMAVDAVLTDPEHSSGTERVAAVATLPQYTEFDSVLNIQGDEPFFPIEGARGAAVLVERGCHVGTAGAELARADLLDPHRVKVVVDRHGRALRFARVLPASMAWTCDAQVLHHIGIYAYRMAVLKHWLRWGPAPGELEEGLEHGLSIGVARVDSRAPAGIDTDRDLAVAEAYMETMNQRMCR
jgi:3-deoxy-manno-octulosonate cytidylyltransferase (CMP-KDO synthetase)